MSDAEIIAAVKEWSDTGERDDPPAYEIGLLLDLAERAIRERDEARSIFAAHSGVILVKDPERDALREKAEELAKALRAMRNERWTIAALCPVKQSLMDNAEVALAAWAEVALAAWRDSK